MASYPHLIDVGIMGHCIHGKYFQNATVLIEGKLYVSLYYASGKKEGQYFSECYCLDDKNII